MRVRNVIAAEDGPKAKSAKLSSPAPEIAFLQEDSLTPMTTRAGLGWAGWLAGWLAGLTGCFSLLMARDFTHTLIIYKKDNPKIPNIII